MKYVCHINSRAEYRVSAEMKHERIISCMKKVKGGLGIPPLTLCPFPGFKDHFTTFFNLKGKMEGISSGFINYRIRNKLEDKHSSDDRIYIDFSTKKVNISHLVSAVHEFIDKFDAYLLFLYPDELAPIINKNVPFEIKSRVNFRKDIDAIYPLQYMDKILVQNVFDCEPLDLCIKLKKEVYNVELLKDGVFIQALGDYATIADVFSFTAKMQELFGIQFPFIS